MNSEIFQFFETSPAALPIYEAFERRVREEIGEVEIRVHKTRISFYNRHLFSCVSFIKARKAKERPPIYLVVTFGLRRKAESPRIDIATEPYPNRWTHHVTVSSPKEIDEELMDWVKEAARF